MTRADAAEVVFRKSHSRVEFLGEGFRWLMLQQLRRQSRRHVAERRKQLVVYSFDYIGHAINLNGVYEKDDLDTFFEWMTSIGVDFTQATALDIGANIGNHSLYFSDYFKRVVSFEPHPRTFKLLSLNAELAGNVTCHNVGLSDKEGSAVLSVLPVNFGRSTLSATPGAESVTIRLVTLDGFCELDNVRLLKIDVEGHEYQALSGAGNIIRQHQPIILFEQHIDDFDHGESKVLSLLQDFGYEHFAVIKKYPLPSPTVLKFAITPLRRALWGQQTRVVLTKAVVPDFYSFIVALPGWIQSYS